jgi:hypothetical protein
MLQLKESMVKGYANQWSQSAEYIQRDKTGQVAQTGAKVAFRG